MNALLYGLVVVIWGTTSDRHFFLQQGPVAAPVSIFWRFAVASATMMIVLGRPSPPAQAGAAGSSLLHATGLLRFLFQLLVLLHRRRPYQYRP